MDILNWLFIKKQQLIKTTPNNVKTDLVVLGAEVPFTQRGDGYQTYAMTLNDAVAAGNIGNTKHYELDMAITSVVTVDTPRGIIDILNTGTIPFPPDPAYATSVGFFIDNLDLDLTAGNRDNIYVQYSVYYSQLGSDNTIPHLIATGASPIGLGFNLYNANPIAAGVNNWDGELYVYFELYTIN